MKRRVEITVIEERIAKGRIGPCEMKGCFEPATSSLVLSMDGVRIHTWTCPEHRAVLIPEPVAA